jgi:hypothetical protein
MSIEDGRRVISSLSDTEVIYVLQGGVVERISNLDTRYATLLIF